MIDWVWFGIGVATGVAAVFTTVGVVMYALSKL